jgi:hypothetical protein
MMSDNKKNILEGKMQDSGERQQFDTGAVRDTTEGKGRFDLISPEVLFRLARWTELGAIKYADRNWEKGMPISRCVDSGIRHFIKYLDGWNDEDHLAAVVWNAMAIMHFEKHKPELQDLPSRTKQIL